MVLRASLVLYVSFPITSFSPPAGAFLRDSSLIDVGVVDWSTVDSGAEAIAVSRCLHRKNISSSVSLAKLRLQRS